MARNAFALALLTALALGGCSTIKGALNGDKEEKAAQAKLVALRARTDSLRKARRHCRLAGRDTPCRLRRLGARRPVEAGGGQEDEERQEEEGAGSVAGTDRYSGPDRPANRWKVRLKARWPPISRTGRLERHRQAAAQAAAFRLHPAAPAPRVGGSCAAHRRSAPPPPQRRLPTRHGQCWRRFGSESKGPGDVPGDLRLLRLRPRPVQLAPQHGQERPGTGRPAAGGDLPESAGARRTVSRCSGRRTEASVTSSVPVTRSAARAWCRSVNGTWYSPLRTSALNVRKPFRSGSRRT